MNKPGLSGDLSASENKIEDHGADGSPESIMGVGVDAPGRDHHSTASSNGQGHRMTNGYNSEGHNEVTGQNYQGKRI